MFKYIYGIHMRKMAYLIYLCVPVLFTVLLSTEPREKRKLIRSLSMFIISLQFHLSPLSLVFSVLSTSEHRSCSTMYVDIA